MRMSRRDWRRRRRVTLKLTLFLMFIKTVLANVNFFRHENNCWNRAFKNQRTEAPRTARGLELLTELTHVRPGFLAEEGGRGVLVNGV